MQVNGAKRSVLLEVSGTILQQVLAAQLFLNGVEIGGNIFQPCREEGTSSGCIGDRLQDVVTLILAGTDVSAYGVDRGLGALALLDGVRLQRVAVVVVSVRDEDQSLADGAGFAQRQHLIAAGGIERVEERSTAAGAELLDALV